MIVPAVQPPANARDDQAAVLAGVAITGIGTSMSQVSGSRVTTV